MSEVLKKNLARCKGRRIIAVTTDGGGYMGRLEEFDEHFIVIRDVYESTTSTALTWHKVHLESPILINGEQSGTDPLQPEGKKIGLERVVLNVAHVIRIWPV